MEDILKIIHNCGIIPVIKLEDAKDAVPLSNALLKGGINVAEITFRTNAAEESIKNVSNECEDMLVGAGTVLNVELAKKAVNAGAKFVVTPGFNRSVVEYCLKNNICVLPGISSPSDIEMALEYDLKVVKFFPAETSGGLKALKAMSAPYSMLKFMPTGGIDEKNLGEYLKFEKVIACGGSFMVKEDLIKSKNFEEITKLTKNAVSAMLGFQFGHMAINPQGNTSENILNNFNNAFGFTGKETSISNFASPFIEVMKEDGYGKNGHIGIVTNNVERAMAYLLKNGFELDYETLKKSDDDKPKLIYLKESIGNFKVHIFKG